MPIAQYTIGPPTRPNIQHDNGHLSVNKDNPTFDPSKYRNPTAADFAQRAKWLALLEGGEAGQGTLSLLSDRLVLPDALPAYRHFQFNKGKDRVFSYERYVASDSNGAIVLASAIEDAQGGAMLIYISVFRGQTKVHFQMTGSAISVGSKDATLASKFPYPATTNWQFAIGGHSIWISAEVDVVAQNNIPQFTMVMTLHAEDRYNFDYGKQAIGFGIPDSENGAFEVTRLAQQYMNYGTLQRTVTWTGIESNNSSSSRSDSKRDRKPSDNIRIRNRL
jgi:hypothetical protein